MDKFNRQCTQDEIFPLECDYLNHRGIVLLCKLDRLSVHIVQFVNLDMLHSIHTETISHIEESIEYTLGMPENIQYDNMTKTAVLQLCVSCDCDCALVRTNDSVRLC